jgi:hypothetical protein
MWSLADDAHVDMAPSRRELHGIRDEVVEQLAQPTGIPSGWRITRRS